ncbi:hypothetical protein BG015_010717 [Linnemannia schmuckeri]|uniref:CCHC-type domain-containing protein n=1 Tax=Linnemannia schmuckeri TaxID=64567 RepID=A0A9P5RX55_9FUNG|nr:hypothetical protein BG015_010717 [Linnemannia schmuckeri]
MAYSQISTTTNTNSKGNCHSSKGNRMHPYLEFIHRDMNRTYETVQAQIRRSRMESLSTQLSSKIHINNSVPTAQEPMLLLSDAVESLLNQFTDSQANSYQQLADYFLKNNSNNSTIATSSADNDTITAIFATKRTPPLSTVSSPDHMLGDSARSPNCPVSHDITEMITLRTSRLASDASAGMPLLSIETYHFNNDCQHSMEKDKDRNIARDMDKDMDTAPSTSDPTIAEEPISAQTPDPTSSVMADRTLSLQSPSPVSISKDTAWPLDKVAVKEHGPTSTELTLIKTNAQPISSSITVSVSSSSYKESKESLTFRESKNSLSPSTSASLSPSSSARTFAQLQPLLVKYNADNNLTLPDFVRQLKEIFDCNPVAIMSDADRVKFAIRSMGTHTARYFEPFLNKSVPDSRKCLTSYGVFLKTLEDRFGEPPSIDAVYDATVHLSTIKQTGTMCNYITTFRDLTAVLRLNEFLLVRIFRKGISPVVMSFLGNADNIKSLSMLQVAATRAYSMHRIQPHSRMYNQHYQHSTSFDLDLDLTQGLLRRHSKRIQKTIQGSSAPSSRNFSPTSTAVSTPGPDTDADGEDDAVSPTGITHAIATARTKAYANAHARTRSSRSARTFFRSDVMTRLSEEEKQYRKDNHLCRYCGGKGHAWHSCPLKKSNDKRRNEVHELE